MKFLTKEFLRRFFLIFFKKRQDYADEKKRLRVKKNELANATTSSIVPEPVKKSAQPQMEGYLFSVRKTADKTRENL